MKRTWKIAVACLVVNAGTAVAWNGFGHMTVAAIAYPLLTPAAQQKVAALLKLNPNYSQWVAGVAAADQDRVAFMVAATWPDAIKLMPGYKDDGETPKGAQAGQNIGYADKNQHRYWHFIDTPFSPDNTPLKMPIPPNAQTQIALFRTALASAGTSANVQSYDLVWLIHLVGDVHQPLHATARFDKTQPKGDEGANLVAICAAPCKDELHAYWDEILGTSTLPASAQKAGIAIAASDPKLASITDEQVWITESFAAAKKSVYVDPIGVGAGPFIPTPAYRAAAHTVADQRVALAGARLADLINNALK
jgi:S1/P1 Nuclease